MPALPSRRGHPTQPDHSPSAAVPRPSRGGGRLPPELYAQAQKNFASEVQTDPKKERWLAKNLEKIALSSKDPPAQQDGNASGTTTVTRPPSLGHTLDRFGRPLILCGKKVGERLDRVAFGSCVQPDPLEPRRKGKAKTSGGPTANDKSKQQSPKKLSSSQKTGAVPKFEDAPVVCPAKLISDEFFTPTTGTTQGEVVSHDTGGGPLAERTGADASPEAERSAVSKGAGSSFRAPFDVLVSKGARKLDPGAFSAIGADDGATDVPTSSSSGLTRSSCAPTTGAAGQEDEERRARPTSAGERRTPKFDDLTAAERREAIRSVRLTSSKQWPSTKDK